MSLNSEHISIIRQTALENFGPEVRVWRFGSRVNGSKLGGDVEMGNIIDRLGAGNEYHASKSDISRRDESLTTV